MAARILLSAVSSSILASAAFAQVAQDERRIEAPVIVTAPGPDRTSNELIGNAASLDRDQVLDRLASTLGDTISGEPGISSTFFGQGASRPVLRGLGAERVQVLTNGIGVIDVSAASPDHQVTTDGIDAERIEILRGPAALAYGGQAIGGVVNVIDGLIAEKRPEQPVQGDLLGAYNSVNEGTELAGRARFASGPVVLSLTASARDFGDYDVPGLVESSQLRAQEALEGDSSEDEARKTVENSFVETQSFAGGLSWVGDHGFLGVAVRRQTATYGLPGGHEHGADEGGEEAEEELPFIDLEQTRVDLRGGLNIDGEVLKQIVASISFSDYTHTEFEAPGEPGTLFESDGYEARMELDHAIAGFEGAIGFQAFHKSLNAQGDEAFITPTDTKSLALFVYETIELDTGLGFEGGARLERLTLDNIVSGEVEFDLFGASAGVHRHLTSGWFFGGQASYTERAPNESELFAFGPHLATRQFEVGDVTLDKETGIHIEGAARWSSDRFSIGANIFRTAFNNFIYLTPGSFEEDGVLVDEEDGLPVFVFAADDATFLGGEIYTELRLHDGPLGGDWTFKASADLVDAELDSGSAVPFIPPFSLNGDATGRWGAFEFGAGVHWAGAQDDPGAGQLPTDSYTIVDLSAAVDLSHFDFGKPGTKAFIQVQNVTDEDARLATSVLRDFAPLPGRNVRAGLRLSF